MSSLASQVYATSNATNGTAPVGGGWKICNHWCGGLSEDAALRFNAGKNETLGATARLLGPKANFFFQTDQLIKHNRNPQELIAAVDAQLAVVRKRNTKVLEYLSRYGLWYPPEH